jgi:hypothetical protein
MFPFSMAEFGEVVIQVLASNYWQKVTHSCGTNVLIPAISTDLLNRAVHPLNLLYPLPNAMKMSVSSTPLLSVERIMYWWTWDISLFLDGDDPVHHTATLSTNHKRHIFASLQIAISDGYSFWSLTNSMVLLLTPSKLRSEKIGKLPSLTLTSR